MSPTTVSRCSTTLAALLLATGVGTAQALPERLSADAKDAVARLQANTGGALTHKARPTVAHTLLRAGGPQPLMADAGAGNPADRARLFLSIYGAALGIDQPAGQLALKRITRDLDEA